MEWRGKEDKEGKGCGEGGRRGIARGVLKGRVDREGIDEGVGRGREERKGEGVWKEWEARKHNGVGM